MKRPTILDLSIAACVAIIALQGCGGSDPAQEQASTATAAPTTIQLFGDSTQFLAAPYWAQRYPGLIDNQAVPGTSTAQLIAGTDSQHEPWPFPVKAGADVVIKFGANDALPWFNTSVAQFKANLRTLLSGIKASSAVAILETPDPTLDVARPDEPAYTQAVRDVARETGTPLIDTDACWRARAGGWADLIGPDAEHATEAGRAYTVTNCVAPAIDALLAKAVGAS